MINGIDWKNESGSHLESHARKGLVKILPWILEDLKRFTNTNLCGRQILEIGCGPGLMLPYLCKASERQVFAIDVSHNMLKTAASEGRIKDCSVAVADVERLPFKEKCFDIVFSRGSIFFWNNLETALQSIFRSLNPGGMAMLGGGYGLSTPQELIDDLKRNSEEKSRRIPRLDLDELLAISKNIFSQCEIKQAPKRGFWLIASRG